MITTQCPSCGSSKYSEIAKYRSLHASFANTLVKCSNCSLVYAEPMPTDSFLSNYNSNYFKKAHNIDIRAGSNISMKLLSRIRFNYLQKYFFNDFVGKPRILEIGPGFGYLAKEILSNYPTNSYSAVEADSQAASVLKSYGINLLTFDSLNACNQDYDLVIMSHVLEHIPNPSTFINILRDKLSVQGSIFIDVPCSDYLYKRINEPHVIFFDKHSLSFLLSSNGFIIKNMDYFGPNIPLNNVERPLYSIKRIARKVFAKLYDSLPQFQWLFNTIFMLSSQTTGFLILTMPSTISNKPSWWIRCICSK